MIYYWLNWLKDQKEGDKMKNKEGLIHSIDGDDRTDIGLIIGGLSKNTINRIELNHLECEKMRKQLISQNTDIDAYGFAENYNIKQKKLSLNFKK